MNTDLAVISFIFAFTSAATASLAAVTAWLIYKTGADKKDAARETIKLTREPKE